MSRPRPTFGPRPFPQSTRRGAGCDVSFQTALNWWGAVPSPASHIALLVILTDPGAPAFFAQARERAA